ncbi:hypothetical protein K490DRAFT_70004 [Saccharata proteae CBS 121410]|uniref:Uncharacterized protein n=1 Tax=Saccharata proteae CBS 121410 TaxID=1314787 RepID=A0A9P4HPH4_9PEZI|nr:hypothetical protein K490DRAFT_70004 [Saccharata proteae CBS 121410]
MATERLLMRAPWESRFFTGMSSARRPPIGTGQLDCTEELSYTEQPFKFSEDEAGEDEASSSSETHISCAESQQDEDPIIAHRRVEPQSPRAQPLKRKKPAILRGLESQSIIHLSEDDDETRASSPPAATSHGYVTRAARNGRQGVGKYDMKYHPMDSSLKPKYAAKRGHATEANDDESSSDEDKDGFRLENDSDNDDENPGPAKRLKTDGPSSTYVRRSGRALTQKPVNYNKEIHPQDSQLADTDDEAEITTKLPNRRNRIPPFSARTRLLQSIRIAKPSRSTFTATKAGPSAVPVKAARKSLTAERFPADQTHKGESSSLRRPHDPVDKRPGGSIRRFAEGLDVYELPPGHRYFSYDHLSHYISEPSIKVGISTDMDDDTPATPDNSMSALHCSPTAASMSHVEQVAPSSAQRQSSSINGPKSRSAGLVTDKFLRIPEAPSRESAERHAANVAGLIWISGDTTPTTIPQPAPSHNTVFTRTGVYGSDLPTEQEIIARSDQIMARVKTLNASTKGSPTSKTKNVKGYQSSVELSIAEQVEEILARGEQENIRGGSPKVTSSGKETPLKVHLDPPLSIEYVVVPDWCPMNSIEHDWPKENETPFGWLAPGPRTWRPDLYIDPHPRDNNEWEYWDYEEPNRLRPLRELTESFLPLEQPSSSSQHEYPSTGNTPREASQDPPSGLHTEPRHHEHASDAAILSEYPDVLGTVRDAHLTVSQSAALPETQEYAPRRSHMDEEESTAPDSPIDSHRGQSSPAAMAPIQDSHWTVRRATSLPALTNDRSLADRLARMQDGLNVIGSLDGESSQD